MYPFLDEVAFCIERNTNYFVIFFKALSYRNVSFVWCMFFPCTPSFCEHSSTVHNVLDPSFLALNHCGFSHIEVCDDTVQYLMRNSLDLHLNVILEHINGLGLVSIDPAF